MCSHQETTKETAFLLVMFLQLSSSFTPLKMQDPELVNQLKERLPEALFEKLNGSLSIDRDRLRYGTCPECRRGDFRNCRNEKNPNSIPDLFRIPQDRHTCLEIIQEL